MQLPESQCILPSLHLEDVSGGLSEPTLEMKGMPGRFKKRRNAQTSSRLAVTNVIERISGANVPAVVKKLRSPAIEARVIVLMSASIYPDKTLVFGSLP